MELVWLSFLDIWYKLSCSANLKYYTLTADTKVVRQDDVDPDNMTYEVSVYKVADYYTYMGNSQLSKVIIYNLKSS